MKVQDKDELIELASKLSKIAARLPEVWDVVDRKRVRYSVSDLESAVSGHRNKTRDLLHDNIFADREMFPTRESIVAFLDSEYQVHLSPDWQRGKLEEKAATVASGKSKQEIRNVAARLSKQNWSVRRSSEEAWQALFGKNEQQIRNELNNLSRFPTVDDLRKFATGLLTYDQMKSITKRETLLTKIVEEITRHSGVSRLGR